MDSESIGIDIHSLLRKKLFDLQTFPGFMKPDDFNPFLLYPVTINRKSDIRIGFESKRQSDR